MTGTTGTTGTTGATRTTGSRSLSGAGLTVDDGERQLPPWTSRTRLVSLAIVLVLMPSGSAAVTAQQSLTMADLWLAPSVSPTSDEQPLRRAVDDLEDGSAELALPVFTAATADPLLGGYAQLYAGRALLELDRLPEAAEAARALVASRPTGALADAALWLAADAAEANGDAAAAAGFLRTLVTQRPVALERVWLRLGRTSTDLAERRRAFTRVYYDFPLTPEADEAADEMARLPGGLQSWSAAASFRANLDRAERLFTAKRYADARKAFAALKSLTPASDRPRIELRLAQCDLQLKKYPAALAALTAYMKLPRPLRSEAEYTYISTLRAAGRTAEYLRRVRTFAGSNADPAFIEEALNDLATHFILDDQDEEAAEVFAEMYRRFPTGVRADRAAWRSGWWAYKAGKHAETVRVFSTAAVALRRSDYRPTWLYWGARARVQLGDLEGAAAAYRQVIADYRNSYYGRIAATALERLPEAVRAAGPTPLPLARDLPSLVSPGAPPANADLIRTLLTAGLYGDAVSELRRVQRETGASPVIDATIAYALNRQRLLRPAITAMRRAYPQFMAAGGEALPQPILGVIFPVDYWDLISQFATERRLDPFLMAALIAQESTFDAGIRSVANAWGLMQILPSTGARYARTLGIQPFSTASLTNPEVNVRIGMAYFADLVAMFGEVAPALAAYNAGENRVVRWLAERPGFERDEFVDDIPFPETQNYVKRVLGTAEDYRRLYRGKLAGD
jgi:soluble lytic murein transglycosylase